MRRRKPRPTRRRRRPRRRKRRPRQWPRRKKPRRRRRPRRRKRRPRQWPRRKKPRRKPRQIKKRRNNDAGRADVLDRLIGGQYGQHYSSDHHRHIVAGRRWRLVWPRTLVLGLGAIRRPPQLAASFILGRSAEYHQATRSHVRYWHFADERLDALNGRYRTNNGQTGVSALAR